MARPKKLINRIPMITNVSMDFKLHLDEIARKVSKESGKVITVSELMRIALERVFPRVDYAYLYPDEWPLKTGDSHE